MPRRIEPQKSKRKYRFIGVKDIKALKEVRQRLLSEANDPANTDDPVWRQSWLDAIDAEIAKKEKGKAQKQRERKPSHRTES